MHGKSKIKNQKLKLWKPGSRADFLNPSTLLRTSFAFCSLIFAFSSQASGPATSKAPPYEAIAQLKDEEMQLAQEIMKGFPNSDDAYAFMGNVYRMRGNSAEANKFWEKALHINPSRYDLYDNMADVALEKDQPEQAITLWRKALEINPAMFGAHGNIAKALMKLGKQGEAIKELEEEIKISPDSSLSHYLLGRGYLLQQEYEKARKSFEKAVELQPNYTHAHYGLFTAYTRLNQPEKAKEHMAIFNKLKAEDLKTIRDRDGIMDLEIYQKPLAKSYMDAEKLYRAKGNFQKAEQFLKRASELDPQNTLPLEKLGSLYYMTKRMPEALGQFEKISQMDPKNLACYVNIGTISTELRQLDKAERAFGKVIELAPQQSVGYRELARLYLRANVKLLEARKLAEKAVALESLGSNYFVLGWACDMNRDSTGALKALERAMQLEPGNLNYKQAYQHIKSRK